MGKRKSKDQLITSIERALAPGYFISYNRSWGFVSDLGDVQKKLDALVAGGEAERAIGLFEIFLAGCYEKADEIDDSGGSFGDFFQDLLCSWIKARTKAGCDPVETVKQILGWMENDNYGFCYQIEADVAKALDKEGRSAFTRHFQDKFESAYAPFEAEPPRIIHEYPHKVRKAADALKSIYLARNTAPPYIALCEKIALSPRDCENIAEMRRKRQKYADALEWVEKGLALEKDRQWGNLDSYKLKTMKQELLNKTGRGRDALESAWSEYERSPSAFDYENLMKYVPKKEKRQWHEKAMREAEKAPLRDFIEICVLTKEWDMLAARVESVDGRELESISHLTTEKAAKGLAGKHGAAAAKIYTAMGMRILTSKKSKIYGIAHEHFRKAKKLYEKSGRENEWQSVVERVRTAHSRKYTFIGEFEKIADGHKPEVPESFESRARKRWKKQISE